MFMANFPEIRYQANYVGLANVGPTSQRIYSSLYHHVVLWLFRSFLGENLRS